MKHFRRLLAKTISSFIINKKTKEQVYQSIAEFSLFDIANIKKFTKTPLRENSVLLIETNGCHGEVVSAYFKYFKDLGYNVDILMHTVIFKENHFSRHDISDINIFHVLTTAMHKIFNSEKMNRYKAIIVMTPMNYTFKTKPVLEMFPELNKFKNLYLIAHNLPDINNNYAKFNQNHIFGLGRRLNNYPCTNPHLFGNLERNNSKHNITTFITVGGINPKRKNHNLLISAIQKLIDKNFKFKVIIVGSGTKLENNNPKLKPYLICPGRQIGEQMFQYMEQADFFLPLWDDKNPDHKKYRTNQVSGSPQLIYAFNKIPVVQKEFSEFYDFDNKNSIIYENDNLTEAMEHAILMSDSEYKQMYNELDKLSKSVYKESKENIYKLLKQ